MEKKLLRKTLVFSLLFLLVGTSASPIIDGNLIKTESNSKKNMENSLDIIKTYNWTLLFYNDLDYTPPTPLGYDRMEVIANEAFSTDNLNVVVLEDTYNDFAKLWYIDRQHKKQFLEEWGEVDMSNYTTLRDFLVYGKKNYSADRYMLLMCGHGMGWKGACNDMTNNGSFLTMDEIQRALIDVGGVDIICFTPCKMAMVESAYELRNCTEIYLGNEDSGGYDYYRFMMGDLCTMLNKNPDISNINLGKLMIKLMKKNYKKIFTCKYPNVSFSVKLENLIRLLILISTSAIDTSKLESVCTSIDRLAKDLASEVNNHRFRIKLMHVLTQSFPPRLFSKSKNLIYEKLDVYDFAKNCYSLFPNNRAICLDAKEVMNSIDEAVIGFFHNNFHRRAHGLSIYFPPEIDDYDETYRSVDLDFTNNNYWDEFLLTYLN
jgi:hypothetical protein